MWGAVIIELDRNEVIEIAFDRPTTLELDGREAVITRAGAVWSVTGDLDELGTHELSLRDGDAFFVGGRHFRLLVADDLGRAIEDEQYLRTVSDSLTGLFARVFLRAHAPRLRPPCALLVCDIDWLMRLNDQHGHLVGDHVIVTIARRSEARVRWPEVVVRYGGDELVVVLPGCSLADARNRAEGIRLAMTEPIAVGAEEPVTVTMSIGIAMLDDVPDAFGTAMRIADENLQQAKIQGRNRVVG